MKIKQIQFGVYEYNDEYYTYYELVKKFMDKPIQIGNDVYGVVTNVNVNKLGGVNIYYITFYHDIECVFSSNHTVDMIKIISRKKFISKMIKYKQQK